MQGGRGRGGGFGGGRDPFFNFGDPFAGFGGFPGFEAHSNLMSSFFGGRDPFDDPFFARPFGGVFNPSPFGFGPSLFPDMRPATGYIEHQPPEPKRSRGPIIEELDSGDEEEEEVDIDGGKHPRKHRRSNLEPRVEVPDNEDGAEASRTRLFQHRNDFNRFNNMEMQPQSQVLSFQSSSVAYGGRNGAYYTASTTRRSGSDGVTLEENREADTTTRQASHRISRGLHNKGHSVTRKLNSDGRVDTMQTLHNLNEDELPGFGEAWDGKARRHLPRWNGSIAGNGNIDSHEAARGGGRGGWALPSMEQRTPSQRMLPNLDTRERAGPSVPQPGKYRGNPGGKEKGGHSRWKARG